MFPWPMGSIESPCTPSILNKSNLFAKSQQASRGVCWTVRWSQQAIRLLEVFVGLLGGPSRLLEVSVGLLRVPSRLVEVPWGPSR